MSDGTKRKLTMPPWHIPFLEKHNIYKLFHEISRELVIQQPEDHVFFTKYLLTSAVKNIHVPHVILVCSPKINILDIASIIASKTNLVLITEGMILEVLNKNFKQHVKVNEYILGIQAIMNTFHEDILKYGWILADCIKSKKQARRLLDVGILPTHVLHLIPPYSRNLDSLIYCKVPAYWPAYRRTISSIRNVFKNKLIELPLDDFKMTNEDVVSKCIDLINIERIENGPKQPRVLLIGPRGCGRKLQARMLEEKLELVHVDFEYLLCQTWKSDSDIGKTLRKCGDKTCFHPELLIKVLSKRLLEPDCLKQGWVLTGYPFNVIDFRFIDCMETPPNRVIFLECNLSICLDRLTKRGVNIYSGSVTTIDNDMDEITKKRLKIHPKDRVEIINAELQHYCTHYGAMRKYCGGTASVINADQPERWVHDHITAIIMQDLPIVTPREPFDEETDEREFAGTLSYKHFIPE